MSYPFVTGNPENGWIGTDWGALDALAQRDEEEADWASRLEDAEGWA